MARTRLTLLPVLIVVYALTAKTAAGASVVASALVRNLLAAFDPNVRPNADLKDQPTMVSVGYKRTNIEEVFACGSWVYSTDLVDIIAESPTVDTRFFDWNSEYALTNSSIVHANIFYPGLKEPYPRVEISLAFAKKPTRNEKDANTPPGCLELCATVAGSTQCGTQSQAAGLYLEKLTGGREAALGAWPWQVRLGVRVNGGAINWMCGGSIISPIYVVTAAHCIDAGPNAQYVVRVGDHNFNIFEPGQEDIPVLRLQVHEYYSKQNNFANDITILRLARSITYTNRIAPVCLPQPNDDPTPGSYCYVTGWGMTGSGNAPFSRVLREGKVSIISRSQCRSRDMWGRSVKETNICAGYLNGQVDACKGDSGGPLVCQDKRSGLWVLEGIVSFGLDKGCGYAGKPAVYTRVARFVEWIHSVTGHAVG